MIKVVNLKSITKLFFVLICISLFACGAKKEPVGKVKEKPKATAILDTHNINTAQEVEPLADSQINKSSQEISKGKTTKPHAPIELKFSLPEKINLKERMQFALSIIAGQKADNLIITLMSDDGVTIINNQRKYIFDRQSKGQKNDVQVSLLPEQSGLQYFYISATLIDGEQQQSRSFVIPLKIGKVDALEPLKGDRDIQQYKSGQDESSAQGIISMPAMETTE